MRTVCAQLHTCAHFAQFGGLFEETHIEAALKQGERRRQAAQPGAGDQNPWLHGNGTFAAPLGGFTTLLSPQPERFLNRAIGKAKKYSVLSRTVVVPTPARHDKNIAWLPA